MNFNFSRIITLLRKEKGLSQKQVASDLQISQALLSHYEKGIRECGLDFLSKISDYYGVSCDYLLGKTPDRNGAKITIDDIPDTESLKVDKVYKGNVLSALNKKLIINSINIIYDIMQKIGNKELINEVSACLMFPIYKIFRMIYSSNKKNPQDFFSVSEHKYEGISLASQCISETEISCITKGVNGKVKKGKEIEVVLSPEVISEEYPLFATSLLNLIQRTELKMTNK